MAHYALVRDSRGKTLSITYDDGETLQVPESHTNFDKISEYVLSTDLEEFDREYISSLSNIALAAGQKLQYISDRVRLLGNGLYFDGDLIDNTLTRHILRLIDEDGDEGSWRALVAFLENVSTNPSEQSVDAIYTWISDRNLTITSDGHLLAYKGVAVRSDDTSVSINSGTALVNGQVVSGQIPNSAGSIIEMPRSEVDADNAIGCSTGLHAGTWDYAHSFGRGRTLLVKINPRDIVSVPDDCSFAKLRVSRYEVLTETDQALTTHTYYDEDEVEEEDAGYEYEYADADYDYDYDGYVQDYDYDYDYDEPRGF